MKRVSTSFRFKHVGIQVDLAPTLLLLKDLEFELWDQATVNDVYLLICQ